jgi:hypothetical protein
MASPKAASKGRRRRWLRILGWLGLSGVAAIALLWWAVHRFEWAGPMVANSLRAVFGKDAVAKLEDFVYGAQDRFNLWWKRGDKPKTYWAVPPQQTEAPPASAPVAGGKTTVSAFLPKDCGPQHSSSAAPGDGRWVPIIDPRRPGEEPALRKTLLHPDAHRSWSELFVVAVDLRRVAVSFVPGYREPKSNTQPPAVFDRPAKIPEQQWPDLLGAFNGGFMTEHGEYGAMVDGTRIVTPKAESCTIARYRDGHISVATWKTIADGQGDMLWYRQTPRCMVEGGKLHPGLAGASFRHWGATLEGETVIRRSAVGIDETGKVLLVGISNHTSAVVLAEGMRHAGAVAVAQLDVNWSYPKFLLYRPAADGQLQAEALAEGFEFSPDEYLRRRALRDFFYLSLLAQPPAMSL